jgi:hypothetical protein
MILCDGVITDDVSIQPVRHHTPLKQMSLTPYNSIVSYDIREDQISI